VVQAFHPSLRVNRQGILVVVQEVVAQEEGEVVGHPIQERHLLAVVVVAAAEEVANSMQEIRVVRLYVLLLLPNSAGTNGSIVPVC